MKRYLIVAIVVLLVAALALTTVSAQTEAAVCGSTPTHQVRFFDYNDIPLFGTAEDAANASAIFQGAEGTVTGVVVRVPGGERQKYLFCSPHEPGSGSVKIIHVSKVLFAPEALVESIVPRNWRDSQQP